MLTVTPKGIYCPPGNFYIDPWEPVDKAVITHSHSDHARYGNNHYLCHRLSAPILKCRLGDSISVQEVEYNEKINIQGIELSLHPAGHILGSSQIKVEYKGQVWVVSGDYKLENDHLSAPFDPVSCHHFITECTFGMPVYNWKSQSEIFQEINQWWEQNKAEGKSSVIFAYSLGKAQRIIEQVDSSIGKIYVHGAVWTVQEAFRQVGMNLKEVNQVQSAAKSDFKGALIVAPPSAMGTPWLKRLGVYSSAVASGWMQIRGARRRKAVDRGFVLSDHADWEGLLAAVKATGASNIYSTHGYKSTFSRYLSENGYNAVELDTLWEGEGL